MDSEADNVTPIVPHNSVVDFQNVHSADDGNNNFSKRGWRDDRNVVGYQPLKRTIEDGRAAQESLKARLYDRPENSEVFRAMLRPSESLSTTHSQVRLAFYKATTSNLNKWTAGLHFDFYNF